MKKTLSIILTLVLTVSMLSVFQASALNPLIVTADDLLAIAKNPSASYRLGADIDMSKITLTKPIAESFSGTLDGNGYSIKNLTIKGENAALFGTVTGTVRNINITDGHIISTVADQGFAAGVAIRLDGGVIEKVICNIQETGEAHNLTMGGIAAVMSGNAVIRNCVSKSILRVLPKEANSSASVGGIVGYIKDKGATVSNCMNLGNITARDTINGDINVGGIVGFTTVQLEINSCMNRGKITLKALGGDVMAGGITSVVANLSFINRCANTGAVTITNSDPEAISLAGGIVADAAGGKDGGSVANCANYALISAPTAGGIVGQVNGKAFKYNFTADVMPKLWGVIKSYNSTDSMDCNYSCKQESYPGFDFEKIWKLNDDGNPVLRSVGITEGPAKAPVKIITPKFRDVKKTDWFYDKIEYALTYKIFAGKSAELFGPKDNMTRAEFVQVLANLEKVDTSNKKVKTSFSDVKSGDWFAPAVKWASDNKIVGGMGNGTFAPNKPISRQEMCVMLINYIDFKDFDVRKMEAKESFKDDKVIDDWAKTKVYACQMADIVNGKGGGIFDPKATALRSEVASLFKNFHQNYIG